MRNTIQKNMTNAMFAELAKANIEFEKDVIDAIAEQGEMNISDAQGTVDFGSFTYVQAHGRGCSAAEIAHLMLDLAKS